MTLSVEPLQQNCDVFPARDRQQLQLENTSSGMLVFPQVVNRNPYYGTMVKICKHKAGLTEVRLETHFRRSFMDGIRLNVVSSHKKRVFISLRKAKKGWVFEKNSGSMSHQPHPPVLLAQGCPVRGQSVTIQRHEARERFNNTGICFGVDSPRLRWGAVHLIWRLAGNRSEQQKWFVSCLCCGIFTY